MNSLDLRDTIFAVSSGPPPAAIAVVRISGPCAASVLRSLAGSLPDPRRATIRILRDEAGDILDRALLLWLPGPGTATGEDMAELHLHGGRAVVEGVLQAVGRIEGVRAAVAGEYTRRAFANGRIDLAEAEGLADLLAAETDQQRRQALRLAEGGLGRLVDGWRSRLIAHAARVEAAIDFGDDEDDVPALKGGDTTAFATLGDEIAAALEQPPAERLHDGVRIVVAGPVNAGKSSLINALANRDAAIISALEGTTRDLIEVPVIMGGVAMVLIDSAGLRDAIDPIEQIGVERARAAIERADLLLWLGDPIEAPAAARRIIVHAQADLPDRASLPEAADVAVSVVSVGGTDRLREMVVTQARQLTATSGIALNARHRMLLSQAVRALSSAAASSDIIVQAEELRAARHALEGIAGRNGIDEMLDALFARFCVGK